MDYIANRANDPSRKVDTFPHFDEVSDPKTFQKHLSAAAEANPHGSSVTVNPAKAYKGHKMFLTPDSKAGYAVSPSGELVSVFKHPQSHYENVGRHAAEHSVLVGGATHLNAYDPALPKMYSKAQFSPVARIPFDPQYGPENLKDKKPDVVFMAANPRGNKNTGYNPRAGKKLPGDAYDTALDAAALKGGKTKKARETSTEARRSEAGIKPGKYS